MKSSYMIASGYTFPPQADCISQFHPGIVKTKEILKIRLILSNILPLKADSLFPFLPGRGK